MEENRFELIDSWSIAEVENNGCPIIIRFRSKLDILCGKKLYPHLLQVDWKFSNPSELGMPNRTEAAETSTFEDLLINSIECDLQSILTFVITHNGFRSWYIYTNNVDEFSNRLHNIPQKTERYPVEICLFKNEGWKYYEEIVHEYQKPNS
jgi:Family of unknown function (DUF695)